MDPIQASSTMIFPNNQYMTPPTEGKRQEIKEEKQDKYADALTKQENTQLMDEGSLSIKGDNNVLDEADALDEANGLGNGPTSDSSSSRFERIA